VHAVVVVKRKIERERDRQTERQRGTVLYVTLSSICVTIVAVKKVVSITYSDCVSVALFIQHAKNLRRITCSTILMFFRPFIIV